jgi:hypothetical protein
VARVILSDQGSNFTSTLLEQLYERVLRQVRIDPSLMENVNATMLSPHVASLYKQTVHMAAFRPNPFQM